MKKYDLHLPTWGPYNKGYLGAAHIADPERGYRFDVNLFPGYYRRSVMAPRDNADCGAKMLASSADLSHYIYRYELEWKDKVYLDADFCAKGRVMEITCDFFNNNDVGESLTLNAVLSLHRATYAKKELIDLQAVTEGDTRWIDAMDYAEISLSQGLTIDGLLLGEARGSDFTGGSYISKKLFGKDGDRLLYTFDAATTDQIGIRYRGHGSLSLEIGGRLYDFELENSDAPKLVFLPIPKLTFDRFALFPHDAELDIDGFALGGEIAFRDREELFIPKVHQEDRKLILSFGELDYTLEWDCPDYVLRTLRTDDPGIRLIKSVHNHVGRNLGKVGPHYTDVFLRPIFLEPHSSKRINLRITAPAAIPFQENHQIVEPICNGDGKEFFLSQKIMTAVTLTNVVWPIYSRRSYIRHNTPGRQWDSLYTWDSGFIGMGLAELDLGRAEDCLNAYLTPVGDPHSPYIVHGSLVPTQIFLLAELYNKTGDPNLIRKYYPMVRQQYRSFADARKTGRVKENGLFALWDLNYNSGGWDDYPTQVYVHQNNLDESVCPMVTVSVTVLAAKILRMLAEVLGEDRAEYDEDIAFYSHAVNTYAWDETSGYYGYVAGDKILKIDGVNGDMGLDGAYPYIAGISDDDRSARIVENIKAGMFTPIGVSVVDTRAPYYRTDGYWNGSVWMPHQWILWKAFLDHGEWEPAVTIAKTALEVWEKEVRLTYNCYEHFMIANGRGAGFHQFSGLSTPVLLWFNALYKPFTVTGGFQTLISEKRKTAEGFSFRVQAEGSAPAILVCLEENMEYRFKTSGTVQKINNGAYAITFSHPTEETIEITQ